MTPPEPRYPVPGTATDLARRASLGVGVAVVAVLLVQVLVDGLGLPVGGGGPTDPFVAAPIVSTTVVAGAAAAVVYAGLIRFTDRPVRNFLGAAGVAFTVQLIPVFVIAPAIGVTPLGQVVLSLYHVLVAVPIVAFLIGAVPR